MDRHLPSSLWGRDEPFTSETIDVQDAEGCSINNVCVQVLGRVQLTLAV